MTLRKLFLIIKFCSSEGFKFSIPSKKLNHADYLVNFELFYRDIHNTQALSTEDLDF